MAADEAKRKEDAIKFAEEEIRSAALAKLETDLNLESNRNIDDVDDTDDLDPEAEKAAWKLRELQRLKREREALIARELQLEELEKRRNMDEDQRFEEDMKHKRLIEEEREQGRGQMEFMQKYYHKGAFYQDDEILKRDYTAPTAEEHRNKENLPKPLQIRSGELGRASRTKYTHLSAEDTSRKDSPWYDAQNSVNKRTVGWMGGMHDPNDRERKRRRS
jgi:microfibrillar-associated protein 1